jgi:hypothetical protein
VPIPRLMKLPVGVLSISPVCPTSADGLAATFILGLRSSRSGAAARCLRNISPLTLISSAVSGARRGPIMFRMPTYDPLAIAVMGLGIVLTAALAFAF